VAGWGHCGPYCNIGNDDRKIISGCPLRRRKLRHGGSYRCPRENHTTSRTHAHRRHLCAIRFKLTQIVRRRTDNYCNLTFTVTTVLTSQFVLSSPGCAWRGPHYALRITGTRITIFSQNMNNRDHFIQQFSLFCFRNRYRM
jgi:hypothetical protein